MIRNCNVQSRLWRGSGCQACLIIATRQRLTVDGFRHYINAIEDAFSANVDFAMLIETYQKSSDLDKRYGLGEFVNALPMLVSWNPKADLFSTSHFEGQNLPLKMQLHRFTRLTNAYSNKLSHLKAALALHFAWYNYCRVDTTLRVIQAMAAGDCNEIWPRFASLD